MHYYTIQKLGVSIYIYIIIFLSKSAYYYDFWRSCDTEDWSNDAGNSVLITAINYIFISVK